MTGLRGRLVAVTGAGGFIGSHLAERLAEEGAKVRAIVRYSSSGHRGWLEHSERLEEIDFIFGDIADADAMSTALSGVDTVFHLAALVSIPYSYAAADSYVRTNVEGTLRVAQAALKSGVRRFVHTSTSEVYGTAQYQPMDENHPLRGQSPYAATKIGADKIIESFWNSYGLPAVTIRPFNTFGPRQSARAVIPTIVAQALAGRTVQLGSVTPTRDFTFVSDTVDGFMRAAESKGIEGDTINLGTGSEISIGNLAAEIIKLVGRGDLEHDPKRVRPGTSEVERLCSDNRKALEKLTWRPKVDLRHGLQTTIEWISQHPQQFRSKGYVV